MRIRYGVDVSLIIPTRNRYDRLLECVTSFFDMASMTSVVEAIVLYDHDDPSMDRFIPEFVRKNPDLNIRCIIQPPTEMVVRDCNNFGAQCSCGRYLWILNDECKCITEGWDVRLAMGAEIFLADKPDRIAYIKIDDDTYQADTESCCFPIFTRELAEAQNGIMPGEFHCHGADRAQFTIMSHLSKPRILDLSNEIKIENNANTNILGKTGKDLGTDETQSRVNELSKKSSFGQEDYIRYIRLLECQLQKNN